MPDNTPWTNSKINWRSRIVKYGKIRADQIVPHPLNPRKHPIEQRKAVEASFDVLGQIAPIAINVNNGYLIDGEERSWLALAQGDETEVDAYWVDLTEEEHLLALTIFDRITYMAQYDRENVEELLRDINTDNDALQALLDQMAEENNISLDDDNEPAGDPGAQLDRAEELVKKWDVQRGQVWVIDSLSGRGTHRLMCGDSYSEDDYARLMNGATPDLLHTDPPYGINIVNPKGLSATNAASGAKPFGATSGTTRRSSTGFDGRVGAVGYGTPGVNKIIQSNIYPVIEGDDRPFDPAFLLDKAPLTILWGANYYADKLPNSSCWIVWDKREDLARNNFADCEMAWTNQQKPARIFYHLWNGLHKGSQHGERRIHPTEKPVALFAEIGKLYADKKLWLDLFAGSGAQIVAAEQSGATCYALEYEPLYVACILQRLADMGLSPRLDTSTHEIAF